MSRVTDPSQWSPNCWTVFGVSVVAVVAVAFVYTVGAL